MSLISTDSAVAEQQVVATGPLASRTEQLFGVAIHSLRMPEAVAVLLDWIGGDRQACRYVVTPNVDHTVMLAERDDLQAAYRDASLVLADGWPVVAASRVLGAPLPERVPGSDLVPSLFAATEKPLTTFLLGAGPGVAEVAKQRIEEQWPNVRVVGTYSPPLGFERDAEENDRTLELINSASPDVLVVGLGAPKQELWVHTHHRQLDAGVALCVGATIDFLAEHKERAPLWMQRVGLEWLHRLLSEPKRMAKRYGRDAIIFPRLVLRQWLAKTTR